MDKACSKPVRITKQQAVNILTKDLDNIRLSFENRRQVFVESVYDVQYYNRILRLIFQLTSTIVSANEHHPSFWRIGKAPLAAVQRCPVETVHQILPGAGRRTGIHGAARVPPDQGCRFGFDRDGRDLENAGIRARQPAWRRRGHLRRAVSP